VIKKARRKLRPLKTFVACVIHKASDYANSRFRAAA
jgi:hypothetical protein